MPPSSPRLGSVLVMTPEGCAEYAHTRALRGFCDEVFEFNFIETFKRVGIVETLNLISGIIAEKKIEVFFVMFYGDSYLMPLEFLLSHKKNIKIVLLCNDDESAFDAHSRYYAQAADAVVTTDYFSVAAYEALGIPAVLCLMSFSSELYPVKSVTRDIDVSFVGNCRKTDRKQYLDFLSANGIKVERFGLGTPNGFLSEPEMPAVFSRSKINLNFSRLEKIDPEVKRTTGHKGRTIETAMTRSFCLSEYYPALPHIFDIGKEIDCFTDRDSLLEKVRYYLSHDKERDEIAARAYARALREYESRPYFDKVLRGLLAIFSGARGAASRPTALFKSRRFKIRQVADHVVHLVSLLLHGRLGACVGVVPRLFQYGPGIFIRGLAGGAARDFAILRAKLFPPA